MKSSRNTPGRITRNEGGFININKWFQNAMTLTNTYQGADVFLDHNLFVANINKRFKIIRK